MRRVDFHTLLHGAPQRGHRVFIATEKGHRELLGLEPGEVLLRVILNGHEFDAEGWPTTTGHVIEVPAEVVDAVGLRGGDAASVSIARLGS